jgi:acetyl/propionyl-CoA carboxylase alpha subunit
MGSAAIRIGKEIGYTNAGTIEFLVDKELNFYFLEMNTRIQVEHPVTEMVTGTDIVEEQILIAEGYPLRIKQEELAQRGHAIECRIYAEDPENNFRPSPGHMSLYIEPKMDHIRIDKGIGDTAEITSSFDPMICKLISYGKDREEARQRMIAALHDYTIHGIKTNILFLSELLKSKAFITNSISTKFCDEHLVELISQIKKSYDQLPSEVPMIGFLLMTLGIKENESQKNNHSIDIWNNTGFWREERIVKVKADGRDRIIKILNSTGPYYKLSFAKAVYNASIEAEEPSKLVFQIGEKEYRIYFSKDPDGLWSISYEGHIFEMQRLDFLPESISSVRFELDGHSNDVFSPMPGKVIKIFVKKGDKVNKGDILLIVEAMKMENSIVSPSNGLISEINVAINDRIDPGRALINIEKEEN